MDSALAVWINRAARGPLDRVSEALCAIELLVLLWLAVFAIVWWRDRPRRAQVLAAGVAATALSFLLNELVLKHVMLLWMPMRIRPWVAHPEEIVPIGHLFEDSSFPSSHTTSAAAVAVVLAAHYPRARVPVALFVLTMALARVHNGMHYPTDVLSGALLGVLYGLAGLALTKRLVARTAREPEREAIAVEVPTREP